MLCFVLWPNDPETDNPTMGNKQCDEKDFVVVCLLVVAFFLHYDLYVPSSGYYMYNMSQKSMSSTDKNMHRASASFTFSAPKNVHSKTRQANILRTRHAQQHNHIHSNLTSPYTPIRPQISNGKYIFI